MSSARHKFTKAIAVTDPDDGWDLVSDWFKKDDDDDITQEMPLPENFCKKCRGKMRELNTGFRKRMYACPKCDK